jgi:putative ABC transport system permease protein
MLADLRLWVTLATRYLWGRKLRTVVTVIAISLAVTLVFGLNGVVPAMIGAFRANLLAATGQVDVEVSSTINDTFGAAVLDRVRTAPGVAVVSGSLQRPVVLGQDAPASSVIVFGADPATIQRVRTIRVTEGRFLAPGDGNVIVLPSTFAQRGNLHVGDVYELPGASGSARFRVVGIASVPGAPGAESVYMPLGAAQQLFIQGGRINVIDAKVTAGADPKVVADAIKRRLGAGFKLGGLGTSEQLFASLQVSENAISLIGLFAMAMGAFIILNTFRTVVSERRRDIGLLRAMGATRRTIIGMFVAEATFQGAMGTALGLVLGYGLAWISIAGINYIARQFLQLTVSAPVFSGAALPLAFLIGFGMTILGALWPAVQASRLTPMEALRPQPPEVVTAQLGWSALAGIVLVGISLLALLSRNVQLAATGVLVFLAGIVLVAPILVRPIARLLSWGTILVFPTEGFIAARNAERQPSRAAVTVSVMMISLAVIVGVVGLITSTEVGFFAWLDSSLGADYLLMPRSIVLSGGNVGAGPGLLNSIRATPGIDTATSLRVAQATADSNPIQVVGIDPKRYPKLAGLSFTAGDPSQAYDALSAGRAIILNGIYTAQFPTRIGDYVSLQTAEGQKRYKVVGVAEDYLNAKLVTGYISQDNLRNDFNESADLLLLADRKAGADPVRVQRELRKIVSNYPTFTLFDFAEWRQSQADIFVQAFAVYYIMAAAIALPGLLALVNTLAMAILERTREIGMLRAVGTTRRQIVTMILAESLVLSTMGTLLGLLAGVWMAYALVGAMGATGFPLEFFFPWQGLAAAAVIGIAFGVIAAIVPARSAARLKIVDALAFE